MGVEVEGSEVGVPALSRRATARATERIIFLCEGAASNGGGNACEFEHRTTRYYWRLGARAATERKASEAAGQRGTKASNVERHSGASEARTPKR